MRKASKKLCPNCQKRRDAQFFAPRARVCEICKEVKTQRVVQVSLSELKKTAQKYFNKFIRERDANDGCISCTKEGCDHAGHYIAQGSSGVLRFNEDNVNGQGRNCNVWKHGNPIEYRLRLVQKIGEKRVEYLEAHRNDLKKWSREELEAIISKYKQLT